ncbi:hypothetical protein LSUE1_G005951 [Lachnellula suecica]|uniref:Uncharacterized protein n=1 Tax=Lachnellula suecica TaxID=602035 RepID=A0A8T9C095_9HELO|nr:hypothetical protein LSUE1_G005951 [Lachnellula suecica]
MSSGFVQELLEETHSDALLLHDACRSADTAVSNLPEKSKKSITELIAACGFQTTAPGVGENSFTHALTEILPFMSKTRKPFSVSELFSRVVSRLRDSPDRADKATPHNLRAQRVIGSLPNTRTLMLSFRVLAEDDSEAWREWIVRAPPVAVDVDIAPLSVGGGVDRWKVEKEESNTPQGLRTDSPLSDTELEFAKMKKKKRTL